jgi:cytochrome c oxidase subunit II
LIGGDEVLKIATVVLLLMMNVASFRAADEPQNQAPGRVIPISAKRFAFNPAQITVKKGETVTLRLTSEDVTHGFYMKPLKIDEEITPGKPTDVTITPQTAGTFTTICDHFCGSGHGNMHMTIVVE